MESELEIVSVVGSPRGGSINRATFMTAREIAASGVVAGVVDGQSSPTRAGTGCDSTWVIRGRPAGHVPSTDESPII